MNRIGVVGCGFLGSLLAVEVAKREFAHKGGNQFLFVDYDTFEERNAANQDCTVQAGTIKTQKSVWCRLVAKEHGHEATARTAKVVENNIDDLLGDCDILVDAVDHLPSRQLLWTYGVKTGKPVLHLGISLGATGRVEWNDDFSLSPVALAGMSDAQLKAISSVASSDLPPCELVSFRGLGLNTALAGAKALYIFLGFDPEKHIPSVLAGTETSWRTTNEGHALESVKEPE